MSDKAMFDAHCLALGKLCVAWAYLDRQLNDLLAVMLQCSAAAAACISSGSDTVGGRCSMLRKLVYEDEISTEWTDLFVALIDRIAQQLGPKRNRFVHDFWSLSEGSLSRLDRRASTPKQGSHQPARLVFDTEHVTQPDEVDRLTADIEDASFTLHCAIRDAKDWKRSRQRVEPPLLARARDHFALQDSLQRAGKAEARPPKSSRQ